MSMARPPDGPSGPTSELEAAVVQFPSAEEMRRRRMAPTDRRNMILQQAAEFFANNGPAASTRALAKALGITQALLYRYFPSKDALVRAVYEERFGQRWNPEWGYLLRDRARSLEARLSDFYAAYIQRLSPADYRLWIRAALEGWSFARLYHEDLIAQVFTPIVAELRHEAGVNDIHRRPVLLAELEIVFVLHGSLTFVSIRRDVYGAPVSDEIRAIVELHVRTILPGAIAQVSALHLDPTNAPLAVPPLSP